MSLNFLIYLATVNSGLFFPYSYLERIQMRKQIPKLTQDNSAT